MIAFHVQTESDTRFDSHRFLTNREYIAEYIPLRQFDTPSLPFQIEIFKLEKNKAMKTFCFRRLHRLILMRMVIARN